MPLQIVEYETNDGRSPFARWFGALDAPAAARVALVLARMAMGNFGDTKSVGNGVSECRIDSGPGYRVYFARDGAVLVILLAGGRKARQQRDIDSAKQRWTDYKMRKLFPR